MEQLSHNHPDNSDELLSAYIDNAVDAVDRRRAQQYIAACAACAQEVQELRMFRELLRELPNVQPRRSFTLDPATIAPQRRLLFPTLRWSSLVAALLFVVVVGVDVLGGSSVGAPTAAPAMPMGSPAAASVAKESPAAGTYFDNSGTSGGSAETMSQPQGSPPAPIGADQAANPESASLPLTAASPAASAAPSPAASSAAIAEASSSPAANDAAAEASPAIAAAESPAASAAPSPAMARDAQADDPAGGTTAQIPQSGFRTNEPAADTIELAPNARAQGSWWSSYGLRVAEVALGLIALVLGGAALWTWRRQL